MYTVFEHHTFRKKKNILKKPLPKTGVGVDYSRMQ